jgi:hypothetical protein
MNSYRKALLILGLAIGLVLLLSAFLPAGEAAGAPAAQTAETACTDCHNDTTLIFAAHQQWEESMHNQGEAFVRGKTAACAGCHSSEGFSAMAAAGQTPPEVTEAPLVSSKTNCRTCHQIHTTYTAKDFALETTDPVNLVAFKDVTFDGGMGNLCANCHQPRTMIEATDGKVNVDSTHWGPHHGPQSAMLLGIGGYGVEGSPSIHATAVKDTCVSCHMGAGNDHSMEPNVAACITCHADITDFDVNGVQTEVEDMIVQLGDLLKAKGLLDKDGVIVVGEYPEAQAGALWNYIYILNEDSSAGVHNAKYTKDLLEASITALK